MKRFSVLGARNRSGALKVGRLLVVSSLLAIGLAQSARADITYTYTGNPFTTFIGYGCPPSCPLTGSFTLSQALPADFTAAPVNPVSYDFTDGSVVWTESSSTPWVFIIGTNAQDDISAWGLFLKDPITNQQLLSQNQIVLFGYTGIADFSGDSAGNFAYNNHPGVWSSSVPEPPTYLLLGAGLLGLAMLLRLQRNA